MNKTVAAELASRLVAIGNCRKSGNKEWEARHLAVVDYIMGQYVPHGSGLDAGVQIALDDIALNQADTKLIFHTSYHHMGEGGCYDGWTTHTITIRSSFIGLRITVSGSNRNDIKDYLIDLFNDTLSTELDLIKFTANPLLEKRQVRSAT